MYAILGVDTPGTVDLDAVLSTIALLSVLNLVIIYSALIQFNYSELMDVFNRYTTADATKWVAEGNEFYMRELDPHSSQPGVILNPYYVEARQVFLQTTGDEDMKHFCEGVPFSVRELKCVDWTHINYKAGGEAMKHILFACSFLSLALLLAALLVAFNYLFIGKMDHGFFRERVWKWLRFMVFAIIVFLCSGMSYTFFLIAVLFRIKFPTYEIKSYNINPHFEAKGYFLNTQFVETFAYCFMGIMGLVMTAGLSCIVIDKHLLARNIARDALDLVPAYPHLYHMRQWNPRDVAIFFEGLLNIQPNQPNSPYKPIQLAGKRSDTLSGARLIRKDELIRCIGSLCLSLSWPLKIDPKDEKTRAFKSECMRNQGMFTSKAVIFEKNQVRGRCLETLDASQLRAMGFTEGETMSILEAVKEFVSLNKIFQTYFYVSSVTSDSQQLFR